MNTTDKTINIDTALREYGLRIRMSRKKLAEASIKNILGIGAA